MDKYLLEILKGSNTIIIPGLGAITITNKETGETMFMPYLQHDDGKLAAFISEKDGIDEADAKNMVAKYVRDIKSQLDKGETYTMFQLGEFAKADDGDIEFTDWSNLGANDEKIAGAIIEEPTIEEPVIADEPIVEPEPVIEWEPIIEPEPEPEPIVEVEPEPIVEPVIEPEEVIEPEPIVESEPIAEAPVESDPIIEAEPTVEEESEQSFRPGFFFASEDESDEVEPEAEIEITKDEIEIKQAIEEALDVAPEQEVTPIKEVITPVAPVVETPKTSTVSEGIASKEKPYESPIHYDDDEAAADVVDGENLDAGSIEAEGEDKEKDKASVGFWVTVIVIALLIIAGGAYVGRNYNELKQHIPFLADKTEESKPKSLKEELSDAIKEDKNSRGRRNSNNDQNNSNNADSAQDGAKNGTNEGAETDPIIIEKEVPSKPEVVEKPKVITTPVVSSSSSGPFKVVAGAFSSEANANRLAAEFKAKGLKSEVFKTGELFTVSMQSYATSKEANANLAKHKSMAPGAWILYK